MRSSTPPAPFPLAAVAVNALGALFVTAGLLGLLAPEVLQAMPALQDPPTAWTLLGVGIALDVGATATIFGRLRARRQGG